MGEIVRQAEQYWNSACDNPRHNKNDFLRPFRLIETRFEMSKFEFKTLGNRIEALESKYGDIDWLKEQVRLNLKSIGALEKRVFPKEPGAVPTDKHNNPPEGLEPGDFISTVWRGRKMWGIFHSQKDDMVYGYFQDSAGDFRDCLDWTQVPVTFEFRPKQRG